MPSPFQGIETASRALQAFQQSLDTTSNNIANEERFARQRNHWLACHGRARSASTISAAHLLGEAQAWQNVAWDRCSLNDGPPPAHFDHVSVESLV